MKSKTVKAIILAGAVAASLGLGAVGHALLAEPKVIVQEKIVSQTVEVPVEVVKEVTVEVPKEVVVLKEVDNEKLAVVEQFIFDHNGNIDFITDDLKDSEVSQIADRVVFVNDIKSMAVDAAKSELADLVDKEVVASETLDEDDVERIRIKDDLDEIVVDDIDFDDKDAELLVDATFEHDDEDYKATVRVIIKDGIVDEVELESVDLK